MVKTIIKNLQIYLYFIVKLVKILKKLYYSYNIKKYYSIYITYWYYINFQYHKKISIYKIILIGLTCI